MRRALDRDAPAKYVRAPKGSIVDVVEPGATRVRSGRKSSNTLWGRIRSMHLGGRHEFSTFRLSLGSVLAAARREPAIDEARLTAWMHQHLRVVVSTTAEI